jgi:hypothetical protein
MGDLVTRVLSNGTTQILSPFRDFRFRLRGFKPRQLSTDPTAVEFFAQDLTVQILSPVRFSAASWTWKTNGPDLFSSA